VLATVAHDGRPRLVPICFAVARAEPHAAGALILYSAIDEKPKRAADPLRLARVRDLLARPSAAVLVDRWDEEWSRLAWVRLECRGAVLGSDAPERDEALAALRAKYPQYRTQRLEERPLLRLTCSVRAAWGELEPRDVEAM
jgi:PPOX class probable F420-dependent enzyme